MRYYTDLFSPETYEAFTKSSQSVSGFRPRQETAANKIEVGDRLICYVTKLSRWVGILEVISKCYTDTKPIFYPTDDPFTIRFDVKPLIWLPLENGIPIKEKGVFNKLSFTKSYDPNSSFWTGKLRNSLNAIDLIDGEFLEKILLEQKVNGKIFPIDEEEIKRIKTHQIQRLDKIISVTIPDDKTNDESKQKIDDVEVRTSIRIQAMIAKIGAEMGLNIWLPKSDRNAISNIWLDKNNQLLETLPLNYNETTIKTIEQIDVIWLRKRAIVRAFDVEHTTSIYSGILRMADLLALQPNMNINLHIVAPFSRKEKVFQEIKRPVFSLIDEAPLSEKCTYLSYESIEELASIKHLSHTVESIIDEYAEEAE